MFVVLVFEEESYFLSRINVLTLSCPWCDICVVGYFLMFAMNSLELIILRHCRCYLDFCFVLQLCALAFNAPASRRRFVSLFVYAH